MKNTSRLYAGIGIIAFIFILISCRKQSESNISSFDKESHNMGKNCFDCHKKGGEGKGWFTVAGTVYDTIFPNNKVNPGGKVYLYTQYAGKGALVASLEVDTKGNFYTTEKVDFSTPLYPKVISAKGKVKYMSNSVTTGACNSCHNYSTFKIYIN